MNNQSYDEEAIRARRRQRMIEAKRRKRRQRKIRRLIRIAILPIAAVLILTVLISVGKGIFHRVTEKPDAQAENNKSMELESIKTGYSEEVPVYTEIPPESDIRQDNMQQDNMQDDNLQEEGYTVQSTAATKTLGEDIISKYAVIIDMESGEILAQKNASSRINPASMTKILTVLVAAENVKDLEDKVTITRDITDYSYINDCSNVGFEENETVSVRDLFYGTVLPSGADAAAGLAIYTAGSLDAFADMMNEELKELGLSKTAHFTNSVGIYDENHYCTVTDMAIILKAALDNELCREVLSAHTYTTSSTPRHPEGITISNWFLRRIEDKDSGGEVVCGKTGYVVQSGNCAASYAVSAGGKGYLCVTADANSGWRCIYDHVALYKQFIK